MTCSKIGEGMKCPKCGYEPEVEGADERAKDFYHSLVPHLEKYDRKMIRAFYDYWTEKNKSGTKMKYELEKTWDLKKRLKRWSSNGFSQEYGTDDKESSTIDRIGDEFYRMKNLGKYPDDGTIFRHLWDVEQHNRCTSKVFERDDVKKFIDVLQGQNVALTNI